MREQRSRIGLRGLLKGWDGVTPAGGKGARTSPAASGAAALCGLKDGVRVIGDASCAIGGLRSESFLFGLEL